MKCRSFDLDTLPNNANNQNSNQIKEQRPPIQYVQAQRVVSTKLRGNKLQMSQIRQKQQLKQPINHNNSVRTYLDHFWNGHQHNTVHHSFNQTEALSLRTRTGGAFSADSSMRNKRKRIEDGTSYQKEETMMISSSMPRPKTNSASYRTRTYFTSNNLDGRMNDFMNLMIRNQNRAQTSSELMAGKIQAEGMVPHARKLNSFQKRMKKLRKSQCSSKQKHIARIQLKDLAKTLQIIKQYEKSPLVQNLDFKTSFAPLFHLRTKKKKKIIC